MSNTITTTVQASRSISTARVAISISILVLILLASLHVLSPEFDPAWRMVSEYANGEYGWILSLMFFAWAISSWFLALTLWSEVKTTAGKIGLYFLIAAGVGETMGGLFDINHPLHGLAALVGIGSFPIAAMLISVSLSRLQAWSAARKSLLWTANLTWVSVLLMAVSFIILMVTFTQTGGDMSSTEVSASLPAGVVALVGWANRLLIVVYCVWVMTVAGQSIKISNR